MPSVLALIPARAGSKGVPNKNMRPLGGHSLLEWSIAASRKARTVNRVIVSTDSQEYADVSKRLGAEAPFLRPPEISGDRETDYEYIVHALDQLATRGLEPEFIVHIRPTTPLRDPSLIDAAVGAFTKAAGPTALRSVHKMSESAYKCFELSTSGHLKRLGSDSTALDAANNARQAFPDTFNPNGNVDVLSTAFIPKAKLIHGDRVMPFLTPTVTEVDTEEDFVLLEFQLVRAPEIARRLFD